MIFEVEFEQENDGRWMADIPGIPGVIAYGLTRFQAGARARALALRFLADRIETDMVNIEINSISFIDRYVPYTFYKDDGTMP